MSSSGCRPTGPRHVVLIGPMGCGKSTVGRLLATSLGRDLIDNDVALHTATGMTAREIAARDGVVALHRVEASTFEAMLRHDVPAVITAAASVVDTVTTHTVAGQIVVYLRCSQEARAGRTTQGDHRPGVTLDPSTVARRDERSRELADIEVDTSSIDAPSVALMVLAALPVDLTG